jgi:DNA polymerase V
MPLLTLEDLPEAIPIPYRSTAEPDGLDLNTLLVPNPISTFYLRVRGHRLRGWGVHDGDLLLVDRSIEPAPGHLVVVAHGGRFLLRPLVRQGERWQLEPLGADEAPIPLDQDALEESGMFGVGVLVVHQLLRRSPPRKRATFGNRDFSAG